jgi:hypothetical protein
MASETFLLFNLALAFYNVGTIWAHEIDIFRSWKLIQSDSFHQVQEVHWRKLRYWVLLPVSVAFAGSISLVWYHPPDSPAWGVWGALSCQVTSHVLTAIFWGRWQAKLSKDPLGPASPYLRKILSTHWIRTLLVNAYAFIVLAWVVLNAQEAPVPRQ